MHLNAKVFINAYSRLDWKICLKMYIPLSLAWYCIKQQFHWHRIILIQACKISGIILNGSYLATIAMPFRNSYEHWGAIGQSMIYHHVHGGHHVSDVVRATFRWQCCHLHRYWLQACAVDCKAHRSLAVICKREHWMLTCNGPGHTVFYITCQGEVAAYD